MPCEKSFWTRKNLLRQNCSHPPANAFLIDFGVILRSYIEILRAKARRKMRKCIVVGQFGLAPVRLPFRYYSCRAEWAFKHKRENIRAEFFGFSAERGLSVFMNKPFFYSACYYCMPIAVCLPLRHDWSLSRTKQKVKFTYSYLTKKLNRCIIL